MRIVKTKRTIGKKKYLGRKWWDGRFESEIRREVEEQFGKEVVAYFIPPNREKNEIGRLEIFSDILS